MTLSGSESDKKYKIKRIDDETIRIYSDYYVKKVKVSSFKQMMVNLTRLGNVYHTGLGIHRQNPYDDDIETCFNSELSKEDQGEIVISKDKDGNEHEIRYENFLEMRELSEEFLPYETIIVKYEREDHWYIKPPIEWYLLSEKELCKREGRWLQSCLPPITKRPYIEVVSFHMEVKLSYEKKKELLTYDDVLFASRVLANDGTRSYEKFRCLSSEDTKELILTVKIDN
jgi:hypothetical protein